MTPRVKKVEHKGQWTTLEILLKLKDVKCNLPFFIWIPRTWFRHFCYLCAARNHLLNNMLN
ncbi:hypothetical protein Hanom_Chr09g00833171 [Helianthus anomalus]